MSKPTEPEGPVGFDKRGALDSEWFDWAGFALPYLGLPERMRTGSKTAIPATACLAETNSPPVKQLATAMLIKMVMA